MTVILIELFIDALKHQELFWVLEEGTNLSGTRFVTCNLELFAEGGSYENPRENPSQ
jgi:hypothetical protein